MDYITVKEASKNWGISVRQVQNLCEKCRVKGALRFNRSWAIPKNADKPIDGRQTIEKSENENYKTYGDLNFSNNNMQMFKEILDRFPYSVNISNSDGIMLYANDAFMEGVIDDVRKTSIGTYNIKEEVLQDKWGLKEHIEKAFRGEHVFTSNLKHPNQDLIGTKYGKDYSFIRIYNDLTSFPIFDNNNDLAYVVTVFVSVNRYQGRDEVTKGREYIEAHWKEPFNVKIVAKFAYLSPSRFMKVFKEDVGFSPHEYYLDIKVRHVKEKLLDFSLSVSQAFNECGIDYNSYYTSIFKKYTDFTPMQFRKNSK